MDLDVRAGGEVGLVYLFRGDGGRGFELVVGAGVGVGWSVVLYVQRNVILWEISGTPSDGAVSTSRAYMDILHPLPTEQPFLPSLLTWNFCFCLPGIL